MAIFTIATWNVNSLRVRLALIMQWLEAVQPDVLALQETKLPDEYFPEAVFANAGYFASFAGQKAYNGVAILSRIAMQDSLSDFPGGVQDAQRRLLAMTIGQVRVLTVYVPNGEDTSSANILISWPG